MIRVGEIWRRMRMLARGDRFARELDEEMRPHRELRKQELREAGVSEEEAGYKASREFGNATVLREKSRERWGSRWLEDLGKDLRFGVRVLRRKGASGGKGKPLDEGFLI